MARDWGFRLEDLAVPVDVWQGDADVNVPADHARRQAAAIPGATLHLQPGEGHFMALAHMEEVLRTLLSHGR
jgi:pimeloyl-ACP methyl ester carboxylesterase